MYDISNVKIKSGGKCMKQWNDFLREEDGVGVVEVILILVVLIGLVLIFKNQLTTLVNNIFKTITDESQKI